MILELNSKKQNIKALIPFILILVSGILKVSTVNVPDSHELTDIFFYILLFILGDQFGNKSAIFR